MYMQVGDNNNVSKMKYFGNYMDDVVVREDVNGNRFKKYKLPNLWALLEIWQSGT